MVDRPSAATPSLRGELERARQRTDDLARTQGQGAPALRGDGQVVEVRSASGAPLLLPKGVTSALRFDGSGLTVTDETGTDPRDLTVRNLRVTGRIDADVLWTTGSIRAGGNVSAAGNVNVDNSFTIGNIGTSGKPFLFSPTDGGGWVASSGHLYARTNSDNAYIGAYSANAPAPSERVLKDETSEIDGLEALETVGQWKPARFRWKPGARYEDDNREHAAVYVDELDTSTGGVAVGGTDQDGNRVPDPTAQIAYLTAAVNHLAEQNRVLRAELDELRATA